ncbi:unnamed protein product [Phaedon cochleariae]|nr:unnamed protein product [Phaedon cochleariae]
MYELDTLRTQVEDEDLDKFDSKTLSLRKILINLVSGYSELEKAANKIEISQTEPSSKSMNENSHPFEEASQIQIFENIDELKLKEQQEQLSHVESIHRDVEDLHEMYQNLNGIIDKQGDDVENVARNVDEVQQNVESGTNHLRKAHKLTAVAYPVTGAFLGGIIGGPIGLVAGLKVGGIAALGCAIAGYTGGKWIKKKNENVECEMASEEKTEESESDGTSHKKKI